MRGARALIGLVTLALLALLGLGATAGHATAQEVRAAVVGDSIRVGDVVPVAVRTTVAPGQRVLWPDTLPLGGPAGDLENAARVRVAEDTLADGRVQVTGVYSVTPWRPGEVQLPEVAVQVVGADEAPRTLTAPLPAFEVVSVLPADTAGIEPRPAKGVIGRSWAWWPILLAILALLVLIGLLWWWIRRRRRAGGEGEADVPALPPREHALVELDRIREAGLAERGEMKEFYTRVSAVVRDYLAAVEPGWGEDRTTTELLARIRAAEGPATAAGLAPILRAADQVKFARREPTTAEAFAEWEDARAWVADFRPPPPEPVAEEAA